MPGFSENGEVILKYKPSPLFAENGNDLFIGGEALRCLRAFRMKGMGARCCLCGCISPLLVNFASQMGYHQMDRSW